MTVADWVWFAIVAINFVVGVAFVAIPLAALLFRRR